MLFGTHVSIKGGVQNAPVYAQEMKQTTFQFYTRNARSWKAKPLMEEAVTEFKKRRLELGFEKIVVHMPYLPNLSNVEEESIRRTRETLLSEIERCARLEVDFLVLHLGSHKGAGSERGIKNVITHLNAVPYTDVTLLLENTAGSKNAVGSDFREIAQIFDELDRPNNFGVCLDTCHTHAAGYDLSAEHTNESLDLIHSQLDLRKVKIIHVNDAIAEAGSHRDRHWHIGLGTIGMQGFRNFFHHEQIRDSDLPLILETPITEERDDLGNLKVLRNIVNE